MIDYYSPATIDEAIELAAREGAAYLGGGTWLNSRPSGTVRTLISLEALGLDGVKRENGVIAIGSSTPLQELLDNGSLPEALREAVRRTASRTLRNMVTLGGDLGLHEPSSCMVPALICLDATVVLAGEKDELGVEEYLKSNTGGLIVEIRIPENAAVSDLRTLSRTSHSRKNLVCAAAAIREHGLLDDLRIVAGDCVTGPARLTAVEKSLEGKRIPPLREIEELVTAHFDPKGDFHAGGAYKRYMAGVMVADLIGSFAGRGTKS